ncbi:MAG: sigma-70 family RNA polymerase sigma factor [Lachnospiraceae bacterium]|nr:sigma-70 family RNA polymerase sigma factor [Lachnospiraceae bacterium]
MNKDINFAEQYDKIYRYCYFKLHRREVAEDITQETFLRYLEHYGDRGREWDLRYLYRIAHNLCVDEYRKSMLEPLPEETSEHDYAEKTITILWLRNALEKLPEEEQEILLLRYANEVPNNVICEMLGLSRFALYRNMQKALRKLRKELGEEER